MMPEHEHQKGGDAVLQYFAVIEGAIPKTDRAKRPAFRVASEK